MIEILVGTNRPGANARRVAHLVLAEYQRLKTEAQLLDLADLPQAIFDPASYAEKPALFAPFQRRVLDAAGIHVITPEYNGSFPGVLKYFVDMLRFPDSFERKPVAFLGEAAGLWGGLRAVEQMQLIFGYRNALLLPERVWIPRIDSELTPAGTWVNAETATRVAKQCALFVEFVRRVGR